MHELIHKTKMILF